MAAGKGEPGVVVVEFGSRPPCRRRRVALFASGRVSSLDVVGIGGGIVLSEVAADTGAHSPLVDAGVALIARHGGVWSGKGELGGGAVVILAAGPLRGCVAAIAGGREPGRHVIGVGGRLEFRHMATRAEHRRAAVGAVHMALGAQD